MYDFIGDIHGYADELEALLVKMDYKKINGVYQHPTRKAFFLGDFIDRGPKIKEVINIVRPMVDQGFARTVMANHELNYVNYHLIGKHGQYLRPHSVQNNEQVVETLKVYSNHDENEELMNWFLTLPLFIEEEGFRVIHACWDQVAVDTICKYCPDAKVTKEQLLEKYYDNDEFKEAIDLCLKGPEVKLPNGITFNDSQGNVRDMARVAWWDEEVLIAGEGDHKKKVTKEDLDYPFYPEEEKLVFFGHYWISDKEPKVTKSNAQCLDFSIAKDGILVAYRWDGESQVDIAKFIY